MKIKDRPEYMTKPTPLTVSAETSVLDASKLMSAKNYGSVIIESSDGAIEGLLTERDLLRRVIAAGIDPADTRVDEVMTREIRVANEDDNLLDWLRIMSNERFRRLPITDSEGNLKSIVTQGDFVSYTWPELMNQASTLAKSTVGKNYQIFLILAAVLVYTIILAGVIGAAI
jgi:CBS domain-containing protein